MNFNYKRINSYNSDEKYLKLFHMKEVLFILNIITEEKKYKDK